MSDLFAQGHPNDDDPDVAPGPRPPLAVRLRPRTLAELVGQDHLLGVGSPLRRLAEGVPQGAGSAASSTESWRTAARTAASVGVTSLILWGPPGTGKTTLAHIISRGTGRAYVELSAVTAGVKDVRAIMERARDQLSLHRVQTVLFLDEIHRFTKAQQDALLPGVENRWVILIAATTENPSFSVISPLLSRSLLLTLRPLTDDDVRILVRRAVADERGLAGAVLLSPDAEEHIVRMASGDVRAALTVLEASAGAALSVAETSAGTPEITLELTERAVDQAAVRYDRAGDQHYDVISAFIKSIRGSDVDAGLHYLARMIQAGEDPRFIARRLMILASEDIGLADPGALGVAVAAAQAVQLVGWPEGRIMLAQAVIHLALAPKSNAVVAAIGAAQADVSAGLAGSVPPHLRDGHYAGAAALGHAQGYRYSHDDPRGVVEQQYAPDGVHGREYYHPTERGGERDLAARLARLRVVLRGGGGASDRVGHTGQIGERER